MSGRLSQRPSLWAFAICCWAALLWWLSSRNLPPVGPTFDHADKLKHLSYFTIGSFCFARFVLLTRPNGGSLTIILTSIAFAFSIGASDEFHQTFTPGRSGNDLGDLIADTLGGLVGAILALRFRPSQLQNPSVPSPST